MRTFFFSTMVIALFLAGCVTIPEQHSTTGKYNELRDINTDCLQQGSFAGVGSPVVLQPLDMLNPQRFTVLNWNSYKGKNPGWLDDFERLSSQSDLVVLQEGYLTDNLQKLLDRKQYNWDISRAFIYYDIYTGVLTASTVKPDFLCSFRMFEPLSGIPKTVLISRYPLAGTDESLLLVNIHMINFSLNIGAYRNQLEEISELLLRHQGPLIISGDFNSWSAERMGILTDFMQKLRVEAVEFDPDDRVTYMGFVIDYIFYRQLVPVEAITEKVTTSDHNPMLVTFRVRGEGGL